MCTKNIKKDITRNKKLLAGVGLVANLVTISQESSAQQILRLQESEAFASLIVTNSTKQDALILHVSLDLDPARYYSLQQSDDLVMFEPIRMTLGTGASAVRAWEVSVNITDSPRRFWRVQSVSIYDSADGDGDGIDDVFELRQAGQLNPADPSDALKIVPGDTVTWLERYATVFGRDLSFIETISREVSIFNQEQAPAPAEAISREVSVFSIDFAPAGTESISREVSVLNQR